MRRRRAPFAVAMTHPWLAVAGPGPLGHLTLGTGVVALLLLTISVVLGVTTAGGPALARWPRLGAAGLHRNVSLLVVAFLAVHVVTAEVDSSVPVGWWAAGIPFASAYRAIWLGLGTLAFDLLLALALTGLGRRHIGRRAWPVVHWSAYASWPLAVIHGLGTGTAPRSPGTETAALVGVVAVMIAAACRLGRGWRAEPIRRVLAAGGVVAVALAVSAWAATGPLRTAWSRRTGIPAALIASSQQDRRALVPAPARATVPTTLAPARPEPATVPGAGDGSGWSAGLVGTLHQQGPATAPSVTITISGRLSGSRSGTLDVVLIGRPAGGGVSLHRSAVSLVLPGRHWSGEIAALDGDQMVALVADDAGRGLNVAISLHIDPATDGLTGEVTALPRTP